MKIIYYLCILICTGANSFAQISELNALKSGERIPNIEFTATLDSTDFNSSIQAYKGKALLLDFWGVNCGSCIAQLPKMLKLQEQFGDRLQILVITNDSREEVQHLWKKYERSEFGSKWVNAGRKLPFISSDTIFGKLFPYFAIPAHVWIDQRGIFRTMAHSTTTYAENIQKFLDGNPVEFAEYRHIPLELEKPLTWFNKAEHFKDSIKSYAMFSAHMEVGYGSSAYPRSDSLTGKIISISCLNLTMLRLYQIAYDELWPEPNTMIPLNRIHLKGMKMDSLRLPKDSKNYGPWVKKNEYCYSQQSLLRDSAIFYKRMRGELDNFFKVGSRIEKQKSECWVLKKIPGRKMVTSKGGVQEYIKSNDSLYLKNYDIKSLFNELFDVIYKQYPDTPFILLMKDDNLFDINLPWNKDELQVSIPKIRTYLNKIGLDLLKEIVNLNTLVLEKL